MTSISEKFLGNAALNLAGNLRPDGPNAAVLCVFPVNQREVAALESSEISLGCMLEGEKSFYLALNQSRYVTGKFVF